MYIMYLYVYITHKRLHTHTRARAFIYIYIYTYISLRYIRNIYILSISVILLVDVRIIVFQFISVAKITSIISKILQKRKSCTFSM